MVTNYISSAVIIERITDNSSFIEYLKKIDSTNKEQIKKIIQDLELFTAINDEQKVCEINDLPSDFIENYYSIDKYDQIFNFKFGDIKLSSGQYHFLLTFSELFYSINQFNENRNFALYFDETDLTEDEKQKSYNERGELIDEWVKTRFYPKKWMIEK